MEKTIDVLIEQLKKVNAENEKLKFRLSDVSGMLIDFCQSMECHDIHQGTKGIKEGVEDYLKSINFH